jgi:hypothetical protein
VQHQPFDDGLKLFGPKDDLGVGDRMRTDRLVAEATELDIETASDDGAQPLGCRACLFQIVVNVRMVAAVRAGSGDVAHRVLPARGRSRGLRPQN